ncbi:Zinc finger protein CONSTANS-LIKE [Arachis hypogaea]|nr:Zinc finger protein CONSTANS-LIKE [Arachis hypogaea]
MFFSEIDSFLDFDYSNSFHNNNNNSAENDIVIFVQSKFALMMNHHTKVEIAPIRVEWDWQEVAVELQTVRDEPRGGEG